MQTKTVADKQTQDMGYVTSGTDKVSSWLTESLDTKRSLDIQKIAVLAEKIITMYKKGGKLLIAGNGGSAADAQHFSAELLARYKRERKSLPALALHTDTSTLTAWSNDYAYDSYVARMVEGLGQKDDLFIAISTSGNSKNLIEAINVCRKKGIGIIGLLGKDGGKLKALCDDMIIVSSDNTPRIQESHIFIIHAICELVDDAFASEQQQ